MEWTGKVVGASVDPISGAMTCTVTVNEKDAVIRSLADIDREKEYAIKVSRKQKRRSLDANAMLWACLADIAQVLRADKWEVYLKMLKRYGTYTYITAKPHAVEKIKKVWRECEEVGTDPNGDVEMLCYYGSSTYDTQEFSVLLDGVISEMKELGIKIPLPKDVERSLAIWDKKTQS